MTLLDDRQRQFEEYLRDGIGAVKNGQTKLAESLLNRAIYINGADSRPYLWLSETTKDPQEQIALLEKAVGIDPTNISARRGLAMLRGRIDESKLVLEGRERDDLTPLTRAESNAEPFLCPYCGGRMAFSVQREQLLCEYCGFATADAAERNLTQNPPDATSTGALASIADRSEQVLDFVIPTTSAHRWASTQQHIHCVRCGALSMLAPGEQTLQCPYCGSNQVLKASAQDDLIEPQLIGMMKVSESKAASLAHRWLGKGFFSPDNLIGSSLALSLRPGYYSFWTFDGTVEIPWTCEVAEDRSQTATWTTVSGVETRFFNDVLVPGVKALTIPQVKTLEPFNLQDLKPFNPGMLAGWPAVYYDRSLSDASLVGREKIVKMIRPQLPTLIEPGREKRALNIGSSSWSGLTYKHILLPLWVGEYRFQGKLYRLQINGQTGEVVGEKPRDSIKIVLSILSVGLIVLAVLLIFLLLNSIN